MQTISYSGGDDRPAASPDGKTVAFPSERGREARIWLKDLKRDDEFKLTGGPDDELAGRIHHRFLAAAHPGGY